MSSVTKLEEINRQAFVEFGYNADAHAAREGMIHKKSFKSDELRLYQLRKMYVRRLKVFSPFLEGDDQKRAQSTIRNLENQNA